ASTLGQAADIALALPQAREACPHNLAPTTSSLMQLALGDALAIALLESRGFTALDFRALHPGGRLGAALTFVRDLMHTGPEMPLRPIGTRMSDAIVEMSAKGWGCVGITDAAGHLVGIITDGDLRRHMRPDLLEAVVEDVMTWGPNTVRPDQLASEALEILNSLKRTVLLVVEGGRAVGLVHMHDLLRAGVAGSDALRHPAAVGSVSSVVRHLSSVICRPSSVVRHLSFVICRPSSVVRHLSSVICRSSSAGSNRPYRSASVGSTIRLSAIELTRPPKITTAIGP